MRIKILVKRIIKQILNDKRTLALIIFAPLLVLTLMCFLFDTVSSNNPKVGVYNMESNIVNALKDNDVTIKDYKNDSNIKEKINEDNLQAFISMKDDNLDVTYENSNPSETLEVNGKLSGAMTKVKMDTLTKLTEKEGEIIKKQATLLQSLGKLPNGSDTLNVEKPSKINIETHYIYGDKDTNMFDGMVPILIGVFVFFFVFLISGISLLKERTSGTLDKLLSTPIKRSELIFGYLIGYGLFAILQTIIIITFSIYVLKVNISGSIWLVFLTNIIIAFVALLLGILLSTFANSEFQMVQFIPLIIIPQIFLSGIIPLDNMSSVFQTIAKAMPMYYGGDALTQIIIKGNSINSIAYDLGILLLFAVCFTILNIVGLKRYRKV